MFGYKEKSLIVALLVVAVFSIADYFCKYQKSHGSNLPPEKKSKDIQLHAAKWLMWSTITCLIAYRGASLYSVAFGIATVIAGVCAWIYSKKRNEDKEARQSVMIALFAVFANIFYYAFINNLEN